MHRFRLSEDDALERLFEGAEPLAIGRGRLTRRNPGDAGDDALDVGSVDYQAGGAIVGIWRLIDRNRRRRCGKPDHCAGFVDEIDRAVGQPVVAKVAGSELDRRLERGIGVGDAMVLLVAAAEPGEDLHRFVD